MSHFAYIASSTLDFYRATYKACLKHTAALWELDRLGYQPVYKDEKGRYHVLGRNTAYRFMTDLGYEWNETYSAWQMPLPF